MATKSRSTPPKLVTFSASNSNRAQYRPMNGTPAGSPGFIQRYFRLAENETTVRREMLGGLTTFMTMAYIIVVNPQILSQSGMPAEGVLFATCISSAIATIVMGLWANYPLALAPGMSLNAYFTYAVCLGMHVPWPTALGAVFLSGVLFLVLTVSRIREQIVNGIPDALKHSTVVGIGLFIAFVGLRNAKIVVANPGTFVGLGLTLVLMARKISAAILLGIFGTTLLGILLKLAHWPTGLVSMPHPAATLLKLDIRGALHLGFFEIVFAFLFVDLFDNIGTLVGVCEQAGLVREGKIPRVGRALMADAVGTVVGSLTGTSTITSYIESAAGVAAGARTGLSSMLVGALFLAEMFFSPVAAAIQQFATAPALVLVGALMTQSVTHIDWADFTEGFPAFVVMLAMPLTFSIATGLSFGVIFYTIVKIATGKFREISVVVWVLTILFFLRYVYLAAA